MNWPIFPAKNNCEILINRLVETLVPRNSEKLPKNESRGSVVYSEITGSDNNPWVMFLYMCFNVFDLMHFERIDL